MNILTAVEKVNELTVKELEQAIQTCDIHIVKYQFAIRNYDEHLMKTIGEPYLYRLVTRKDVFVKRLEEIKT